MNQDIIISPIISEKSMLDAAKGKFTFRVTRRADKLVIKKAVEETFKVNVLSVATVTTKGRLSRTGTRRVEVTKQPKKKAIVTLKAGQKIALFDTAT
ncbi:MAG: 50S ribosomal protein L23 [Patescibacteria group bacterium]|nr:50S ribosomal protein L23 [Patescibacteria group bacterium]